MYNYVSLYDYVFSETVLQPPSTNPVPNANIASEGNIAYGTHDMDDDVTYYTDDAYENDVYDIRAQVEGKSTSNST